MTIVYILLGLVGGFIALVLALRLSMVLKASRMKGKPAPELEGKVGKHVKSGKASLFYFFSPGCRACSAMTPVLERMARKRKGIFPIDISKDMDTARRFGVMATPTMVSIRDGLVKQVVIGPQSVPTIESMI